jgi:hypothetical protein
MFSYQFTFSKKDSFLSAFSEVRKLWGFWASIRTICEGREEVGEPENHFSDQWSFSV